ncbi:BH3069 [Halalkalibacterium halodurans C-125]|jgi:hypothetical protein|uniref:BH3069 protein n=1 Tax=Halalkalibacterium halodurans (strain ATCC BAA-125 / DSM 18197 / FERM 7344 / JCM 9153 / C-125) TaxID=272558 RepID=Q9K8D7_HALH5|nr:BH3069 [Halalkalibacterium halodurans C-125]
MKRYLFFLHDWKGYRFSEVRKTITFASKGSMNELSFSFYTNT